MNLTELALERNRVTLAALVALLAAGLLAYQNMPRDYDPGFIVRTATVITHFPGASPERVEQLVTDKIEKAIREIPELDKVRSESKTGVSIINVDLQERYRELRPIWDRLRRKVERVAPDLPAEASTPVVDDEFGDVFGTVLTMTGEGFSYAELKDIADDLRDELLLIDEAAKVEIFGTQDERIFIEFNNARLAELGLSPLQLRQILASRNIVNPGGAISTTHERIAAEPTGSFESVEELAQTLINLPGRRDLIYLRDIAQVRRGYVDPPSSKVRASGVPALALAVSLREGGNILALGGAIERVLERARATNPIGIEFDLIRFQPADVERKVDDFVRNLSQAVGIVVAVMLVALGLRTGLVVASLIPATIVITILIMSMLGIGIDQMSLASLIIALGLLVDNAIVMSESVIVKMAGGSSAREAAVRSAQELKIPLLTSSLTTAAAFLPIFLAESATGEYTAPLFKVVTITLLCSWVLTLTLVPLLCVTFLRVRGADRTDFERPGYRAYRTALLWALRNRALALAGVAVVFAAAIYSARYVPVIFFPPDDRPTFTAELALPIGTPIERTEEVVVAVEEFIAAELRAGAERGAGVTNWATFVGRGAPRFVLNYGPRQASPEYAILLLNASDRDVIDTLIPRIEAFCLERFPDLTATVRPLQNGPPVTNPIEVRISGRGNEFLFATVEEVKSRLRGLEGTKNVVDDWGNRTKKLAVRVNQARALRAGVTNEDIALSLQTILSGFEATEYREGDKVIPVTLRSVAADRQDISKIENLNVYSQVSGRAVPLKQVADVSIVWQPAKIKRVDGLRTVTIESDVESGVTAAQVVSELRPWLADASRRWPYGSSFEFGGSDEKSRESNQSIMVKLPIAGFIIVFLLVAQFNSLRRPLIILLTIPLGVAGVIAGLLIARSYFGFMTLLGIISLSGIVINNAIVLLDRIKLEIEQNGLDPARAVLESSQQRLRPILLTTATTIGGLLPLWLGGGPMWEPLAVSIIFGLLFATALTLGVVPVLYSLLFRVDFRALKAT